MSTPLTQHVQKLYTSANISSDEFEEIFKIIENSLQKKMLEHNLYSQPPHFLGYSWNRKWDKDNFHEIVSDCYDYAIFSRKDKLFDHILQKIIIDGMISRNISNFLRDRQKASDRKGYNIFKNVEAALKDLSAAGQVFLYNLQDKEIIRNETICVFDPSFSISSFQDDDGWFIKQKIFRHPKFEEISKNAVMSCNKDDDGDDDLNSEGNDKGKQSIEMLIMHLKKSGVTSFSVRNFVDILKTLFRNVNMGVAIPDMEHDIADEHSARKLLTDISKFAVSNYDMSNDKMDIINKIEKLKPEIEKLDIQVKVKIRLHQLLELAADGYLKGESFSQTDIAREMNESTSTISESLKLLRSITEK